MLAVNNCVAQSTRKTPYEMVFGQPTRIDHDFWLQLHKDSKDDSILNEEDLSDSIVKDLNCVDTSVCKKIILFCTIYFANDNC